MVTSQDIQNFKQQYPGMGYQIVDPTTGNVEQNVESNYGGVSNFVSGLVNGLGALPQTAADLFARNDAQNQNQNYMPVVTNYSQSQYNENNPLLALGQSGLETGVNAVTPLVGGGLANGVAEGLGGGLLARLAGGAAVGAGSSALGNIGTQDLSKGIDLGQVAQSGLTGAALGAGGSAIGEAIGAGANALKGQGAGGTIPLADGTTTPVNDIKSEFSNPQDATISTTPTMASMKISQDPKLAQIFDNQMAKAGIQMDTGTTTGFGDSTNFADAIAKNRNNLIDAMVQVGNGKTPINSSELANPEIYQKLSSAVAKTLDNTPLNIPKGSFDNLNSNIGQAYDSLNPTTPINNEIGQGGVIDPYVNSKTVTNADGSINQSATAQKLYNDGKTAEQAYNAQYSVSKNPEQAFNALSDQQKLAYSARQAVRDNIYNDPSNASYQKLKDTKAFLDANLPNVRNIASQPKSTVAFPGAKSIPSVMFNPIKGLAEGVDALQNKMQIGGLNNTLAGKVPTPINPAFPTTGGLIGAMAGLAGQSPKVAQPVAQIPQGQSIVRSDLQNPGVMNYLQAAAKTGMSPDQALQTLQSGAELTGGTYAPSAATAQANKQATQSVQQIQNLIDLINQNPLQTGTLGGGLLNQLTGMLNPQANSQIQQEILAAPGMVRSAGGSVNPSQIVTPNMSPSQLTDLLNQYIQMIQSGAGNNQQINQAPATNFINYAK